MHPIERLLPSLHVGERVSVRAVEHGSPTDVIGFVTALTGDTLSIVDRRGVVHTLAWDAVSAGKRVPVSRGRDPLRTPPALLTQLVAAALGGEASETDAADGPGSAGPHRAAPVGPVWVARIVDVLAGRPAPETVAPWGERASFGGVRARVEGEWVVALGCTPGEPGWLGPVVDACWWATRANARSVCLVVEDPSDAAAGALAGAGFARLG
jgi:hypothetical protein